MTEFHTSTAEGLISNFYNTYDLEEMAQKVMPKGAFGYVASGAGDMFTLRENIRSFEHKLIVPHALKDVEKPDVSTTFGGDQITSPMIMAPIAAHKLANERGELASAEGVHRYNTIYSISSYSSFDLPDVTKALQGTPEWFQFYYSKDDGINRHIMDRVKEQGIKAIILTADATVSGNRETDARNGFTFPVGMPIVEEYLAQQTGESLKSIYGSAKQKLSTKDVENIASYSGLPVYVKGVESPEDVEPLLAAGASGIWVSNHGGRQLDSGPASFDSLSLIAKAVDKRVPIVFDSGIRRGQHVFKALASGADLVAVGRPAIYGLALGGATGVEQVFNQLTAELEIVMQLAGTQTIADIKNFDLRDNPYDPGVLSNDPARLKLY